jgi:transcription antitermination factor NusG
MNWYAIYTKPKCETKVSALLTRKKIVNFCPLNQVSKDNGANRHKFTAEPLFPNFVFVNIRPDQMDYVSSCNDVINFIFWLGRPVEVRSTEIDNIREFVLSYTNIELEKSEVSLQKMNRVITKMPLIRSEENVAVLSRMEVKLNLPGLGFTLKALSDIHVDQINKQSTQQLESIVS